VVLNLKEYSVWVCLGYQVNHARLKDILLTPLLRMELRSICVAIMVVRTQTTLVLETEQEEVGLKNKIIHMTLGLDSSVL
jgi:hypothetical protein